MELSLVTSTRDEKFLIMDSMNQMPVRVILLNQIEFIIAFISQCPIQIQSSRHNGVGVGMRRQCLRAMGEAKINFFRTTSIS